MNRQRLRMIPSLLERLSSSTELYWSFKNLLWNLLACFYISDKTFAVVCYQTIRWPRALCFHCIFCPLDRFLHRKALFTLFINNAVKLCMPCKEFCEVALFRFSICVGIAVELDYSCAGFFVVNAMVKVVSCQQWVWLQQGLDKDWQCFLQRQFDRQFLHLSGSPSRYKFFSSVSGWFSSDLYSPTDQDLNKWNKQEGGKKDTSSETVGFTQRTSKDHNDIVDVSYRY